ncbi:AraC family transcriptional regulator [Actinosynnema sp. NPDC047251]|uniref:Transcriptional regulator, AraC family n=1 Tax=Saccharothrix espanaensis (strain ATCC 51144 / DSM 44229 / JCM 9112 / NBRC 15066 / NRRL 15764) TaxID=1179773 RepID=K0KB44_SACES|nr:AraC family transcriptional regulator [Saccharothrix espanaensis]CCH34034.1 Transcriptional regulator, AraC family [Saccharothrix espanaensis DSM 44229]
MLTRTIAIHYVTAALRGAVRHGHDVSALLATAGIPEALPADDRARVTPAQYSKLIQALWDALDDEFMGFGPQRSKRGTFPTMCLLAVHCASLEGALQRGLAFYALFDVRPSMRLAERDGVARFALAAEGVDDPDRFLVESLLVLWHRFSSWLIGRRIPLRGVELAYPEPPHAAEYHLIFGCPLRFGAPETVLTFDTRFLRMPVVQDEAALRRFLRNSPAELLSRRDYGADASSQVRRMLGGGVAGLANVAARLGVSAPTLRRKLAAEGTSFREVREQLLRDQAVASLVRGGESVEELALRLGFSEASAFHRAFKRWTGNSPGAYRTGAGSQ